MEIKEIKIENVDISNTNDITSICTVKVEVEDEKIKQSLEKVRNQIIKISDVFNELMTIANRLGVTIEKLINYQKAQAL